MQPLRFLAAGAIALLAGLAAAPAAAQLPAAARWQAIESAHFRVTFTPELEPLARHAAAAAERARAALQQYLGDAPAGRVDIVLSDNVDYSNGSATPFPSNRIFLYARPPVDALDLGYYRDWLELVLVHELAHVIHLDATSSFGRLLRRTFGRVPFTWPLFPAIGSPAWSVEGLAVAVESGVTPLGRLHGTYHQLVARTAALEAAIDDIDRLASASPVWPGPQRVYIYGSLFFEHLQERYGEQAARAVVEATASAVVPPLLWYDRVGERALGTTFRAAYDEWRAAATTGYRALADTLRAAGLTDTRTLAAAGGLAWYPRYSRNGRAIAYTHMDRRSTPRLRVIDARTGEELWARRRNGAAAAAWLPDGRLLGSELEFRDRDHLYYELQRVGEGGTATLARTARLQDVDVSADGTRGIAVENGGGSNRLVRIDPRSGGATPLTPFAPDVQWVLPRWSPRGDLIAVSRWQAGGRVDVVVLDTLGRVVEEITAGTGINLAPAWSPDARYLVFSSDRTGIPNLYAYDRQGRALYQLTSLLTGAFYPDVAPDGRTVVFSAYHHDGFHIETIEFEPAGLRPPAPPRLPQLPATAAGEARTLLDTSSAAASPYRPAGSLTPRFWAPALSEAAGGTFVGIVTGGNDLVDRHAWSLAALVGTGTGRVAGNAWYEYRGLPPLAGTGLQPSLQLAAAQGWDRLTEPAGPGEPYVEEREHVLSARASLLHRRYRSTVSFGVGGELSGRRRLLQDAPGRQLRDPDDDLYGVRVTAGFGNARRYPFSVSAEDGIALQLAARQRWERSPRVETDEVGNRLRFDASERQLTAWSAAYLALGRVAYANAVLALRASALLRDGPGAVTHGVGGSSGGVSPLGLDPGGSQFLPVRGFPASTRRGTRAWSATAELRLPVALLAFKPRPLPLFLDRLSAAAFVDAGNASCPPDEPCDRPRPGSTLLATGGELRLDASLLGIGALLRAGGAFPLQGTTARAPRWYFQLGSDF